MFNKVFISIFLVLFATAAAAAQQQFKIKGEAIVGSKFRQIDAMSPIPFNKSYDELTAEQKELFRATYGGLADSEKPPFPVKGTQAIYKPIIKGHRDIARAGNLFLIAMVDESGKVENVSVYESPANSMTEYATAVLFNTEFEPATCAGEPCKMEFPFEFNLRSVDKDIKNGGIKRNNR